MTPHKSYHLFPDRIAYCQIPNLRLLNEFAESNMAQKRALKQLGETLTVVPG